MSENNNVVHLAFRNPEKTDEEGINFLVCKHCRNKTYTMTFEGASEYPLVKCAACGAHIGCVGWSG